MIQFLRTQPNTPVLKKKEGRFHVLPESGLAEPPLRPPRPVRGDGVDDGGHEGAEDDVAVEVAALRDGAGHDGGARRGEGALKMVGSHN